MAMEQDNNIHILPFPNLFYQYQVFHVMHLLMCFDFVKEEERRKKKEERKRKKKKEKNLRLVRCPVCIRIESKNFRNTADYVPPHTNTSPNTVNATV
jgi:hypothetical protein